MSESRLNQPVHCSEANCNYEPTAYGTIRVKSIEGIIAYTRVHKAILRAGACRRIHRSVCVMRRGPEVSVAMVLVMMAWKIFRIFVEVVKSC